MLLRKTEWMLVVSAMLVYPVLTDAGAVRTGVDESAAVDGAALPSQEQVWAVIERMPEGPNTLACCFEDGSCDELPPSLCVAGGGIPSGVSCMMTDCVVMEFGACCMPFGLCTEAPAELCDVLGGHPQGPGIPCQDVTCPGPVSLACCFDDGWCEDLAPMDCVYEGGTPSGPACSLIECVVIEVEACCLPDGTCDMGPPVICEAHGGDPLGPGSDCADVVCESPLTRACCFLDGVCEDLFPPVCAKSGGIPAGENCDVTECPSFPIQACCLPNGGCEMFPPPICGAVGGEPQGLGSTCGAVDCGGPPMEMACCLPNGGCLMLPGEVCHGEGGMPQGPGSICTDVPCEVPPHIVHAGGLPGQTRPCSGYIDPRSELSEEGGVVTELGLRSIDVMFNEPVFGSVDGGPVTPDNFIVTETGQLDPPSVSSVIAIDGDPRFYRVAWNRPITLQQWTTVRAEVFDATGTPIENLGDLGPGGEEPDRIDLGYLPGDIDQNGRVEPFDLLGFRQMLDGGEAGGCGLLADYADTDRDGTLTPFDLLRFRQLVSGIAPTVQPWSGEAIAEQP